MAASGTGKCLGLTVSVSDVGMSLKLCGFSQLSYYFFRLQVCTDKICEEVCYTTSLVQYHVFELISHED